MYTIYTKISWVVFLKALDWWQNAWFYHCLFSLKENEHKALVHILLWCEIKVMLFPLNKHGKGRFSYYRNSLLIFWVLDQLFGKNDLLFCIWIFLCFSFWPHCNSIKKWDLDKVGSCSSPVYLEWSCWRKRKHIILFWDNFIVGQA